MSYSEVLDGLHVRFATVAGIGPLLKYEPKAIPANKMLYSLLERVEVLHGEGIGKTPGYRYRVMHRMVFLWQDNEQAELDLIPFVNAIPEAVDADDSLGGILHGGISQIVEMDTGWEDWNTQRYRVLDFVSETLEQPA